MMQPLPLNRAFTLLEPGPVTWVATRSAQDGRANVMTITWTMVRDFEGGFVIATGPWNHSWRALTETRACVIAIPGADLIDTVIGVGMTTGAETDKFSRFALTALPAETVAAPLIGEALANVECRVEEVIEPHGLVLLRAEAAWTNPDRAERRTLHAVGDGTFVIDGDRLDRHEAMAAKLPGGLWPAT